jgi:C-terminal, D2-small domain, of ClpB protein
MQKMQSNPKAASMLLEAAKDEQIMKAMRTAMDGSPADLAKAARENPIVSQFLQKLWGDEAMNVNSKPQQPKTSGLNAIRGSLQKSMTQGTDSSDASSSLTNVDGAHPLYPELARVVKEELEGTFKPELLNRIDEIVVFSPLSSNDLCNIAQLIVDRIVKRAAISDRKVTLTVRQPVIERITQQGSANANQFGARPMRRAAQRYVEDSLSDAIVQGFLHLGDDATLDLLVKPNSDDTGKDFVVVERTRDGAKLVVEVEDDHGGIGSNAVAEDSSSNQTSPAKESTDSTTMNGPNGLHLASAAAQ